MNKKKKGIFLRKRISFFGQQNHHENRQKIWKNLPLFLDRFDEIIFEFIRCFCGSNEGVHSTDDIDVFIIDTKHIINNTLINQCETKSLFKPEDFLTEIIKHLKKQISAPRKDVFFEILLKENLFRIERNWRNFEWKTREKICQNNIFNKKNWM
mgnify:CR=1 FL=1